MIRYLKNENLEDLIKTGTHIVDFYADWCGPCKMLGNVLEQIKDVSIIKINVDEHRDLANTYNIMSIPVIMIFQDGKEKIKQIGFQSEEEIRKLLK